MDEFPTGPLGRLACHLLLLGGLKNTPLERSAVSVREWELVVDALTPLQRPAALLSFLWNLKQLRIREYLGGLKRGVTSNRLKLAVERLRKKPELVALLQGALAPRPPAMRLRGRFARKPRKTYNNEARKGNEPLRPPE